MKALASAEKEKKDKAAHTSNADEAVRQNLQLTPQEHHSLLSNGKVSVFPKSTAKPLIVSQYLSDSEPVRQPQQEAAANIFSAARLPVSHFPRVLFALGLIALCLFIWLALQFFPKQSNSTPLLLTGNSDSTNYQQPILEKKPIAPLIEARVNDDIPTPKNIVQNQPIEHVTPAKKIVADHSLNATEYATKPADTLLNASSEVINETPITNASQSSLQLSQTKPTLSVEPTLLAAYQAFNQGELTQAQQLYRQVLQKDVRNIDALLGMAVIAQKQFRNSDAIGWYQKVLEIDPSQTFALSGLVALQPALDNESQINRLKSLIVQQPEHAQFHATLGNLYAEQNRWQEAQAAYFDAVRLAPQSAEFVFNLAVSLEHLRQPQLALTQYQRALQLVERTGATTPDPRTLKTRILALQPAS
jgi:tetratricopeptide (TPR) repeat protein